MVEQDLDFPASPTELWKLKDAVVSRVNLAEIMSDYGIILEPRQTGQFTHRAICPFHRGKGGGKERTPSLYADANHFFCFGCSRHGTVIELISQMEGMPATEVLRMLAAKAGLLKENGEIEEFVLSELPEGELEPIKTIDPILVEIGALLRNYTKRFVGSEPFEREFAWTEKVAAKVDELLLNVGFEDWEYVQDICDKVKTTVRNRIRKTEKI